MFPTPVIRVDAGRADQKAIDQAARVLRGGGLVVFPTETVYGLGANALDPAAVARVFQAKGRPPNNPLIVHVTGADDHGRVASHWPKTANLLAEKFWPGPLTLVLTKHPELPAIVTAHGPTVAMRAPAHPVAQQLLHAAGIPIAAPSANRSGELSPTAADHVVASLNGRVDLILDAGPTAVGIESTVIDLTADPPRLLRPGHISPAQIEAVIGPIVRRSAADGGQDSPLPSPGMLARHYAPRTPMRLATGQSNEKLAELAGKDGSRIGWLTLKQSIDQCQLGLEVRPMPNHPADYAARLYSTLHELDGLGLDWILVDVPPATDEWLAVFDRLSRAAAQD
jgi:L-threonylcarbamoyladenylate synthase